MIILHLFTGKVSFTPVFSKKKMLHWAYFWWQYTVNGASSLNKMNHVFDMFPIYLVKDDISIF